MLSERRGNLETSGAVLPGWYFSTGGLTSGVIDVRFPHFPENRFWSIKSLVKMRTGSDKYVSAAKVTTPTAYVSRVCLIVLFVMGLSGCSTRIHYDSPPFMPVVIEPAKEAILKNGTPVSFRWRMSAATESYEFHIFDRTSVDIQRYYLRDLMPDTICSAGVCSVTLTLSMPADSGHAWRVRAYNNAGFSAWTRHIFAIE